MRNSSAPNLRNKNMKHNSLVAKTTTAVTRKRIKLCCTDVCESLKLSSKTHAKSRQKAPKIGQLRSHQMSQTFKEKQMEKRRHETY